MVACCATALAPLFVLPCALQTLARQAAADGLLLSDLATVVYVISGFVTSDVDNRHPHLYNCDVCLGGKFIGINNPLIQCDKGFKSVGNWRQFYGRYG